MALVPGTKFACALQMLFTTVDLKYTADWEVMSMFSRFILTSTEFRLHNGIVIGNWKFPLLYEIAKTAATRALGHICRVMRVRTINSRIVLTICRSRLVR